jgi:hypothetical protein
MQGHGAWSAQRGSRCPLHDVDDAGDADNVGDVVDDAVIAFCAFQFCMSLIQKCTLPRWSCKATARFLHGDVGQRAAERGDNQQLGTNWPVGSLF